MIAQLLNQQFVLDAAKALVEDLDQAATEPYEHGAEPHPADEVESEEFAQAAAALRQALAGEAPADA